MKRRIEQLLNGKFEYETPTLMVRPEELKIEMEPGRTAHGSFVLESQDGKKVKGFLYSSNPRMMCEPAEFQGFCNEIRYQADGNGFPEEAAEEGFFTICSELGEYRLPFILQAKKRTEQAAKALPFEEPKELCDLAQEDFQAAYRIFISEAYQTLLKEKLPQQKSLYDSLSVPSFTLRSMEEFLTGAGWKEAVQISVDRTAFKVEDVSEPVAETVQISKNTWGFQKITVQSDAAFVHPEKKVITTDEFAGSTYGLNLVIDAAQMHAGRNYARVTLSTPYQQVTVEVTAVRSVRASVHRNHTCRLMQKKLEELYIGFRLKKCSISDWVEQSVKVIENYKRCGGTDLFADLFLVQLYFADGKMQKASQLLDSLRTNRELMYTPERYGYYLYLTTFFHQEISYVDQAEEEIRKLFYRNKTNWKLQWILLYLQESLLEDETAKYEAVLEQFRCGCRSRIMYQEAYQILRDNPFLMHHLGSFELQLLRFAKKEQVLTAELVRQTANLTVHYGKYSPLLFDILTAAYEQYPSEDLVRAACLQLMKGERRDAEAFVWYARGVEQGLRITGLYEYYMESMEDPDLLKMPQIIRMYFAYDTTLDYRKRAAIYSRILANREEDPNTWRNYHAAIGKFAVDQLGMGRMTEELAQIYRACLRRSTLTRAMAEQLARFLFAYEITCDSEKICSVTAHSAKLQYEQSAVFADGKAVLTVYDPDSVLIVEDREGGRYLAETFCTKRRLFEQDEMLAWCTEKIPEFTGIVLFVCCAALQEQLFNEKTLPYLIRGCELEDFSEAFRDTLREAVLHYYMEHPREESLPEFLKKISYLDYVRVDKTALITLLAEEGLCSEAFSLLDVYGAEGIPLLRLVRICSRMVLELEFAENTMLLALCHFCFESGKYDDKLLRYLLLYYEGSIQQMEEVWDAARRFDLDTMLIEEKIMMMLLFTRSHTEGSEPVFEAYAKKMGRRRICRAYLNLKAYEYFVKGLPVAECVFRYIERDYVYLGARGRLAEQEEVCRLALLQRYAKYPELTGEQRGYTKELLEEFSAKGMRFAFWKRFDQELLRPYQMEGRVFAEYVGNPQSSVTIYYRRKGSEEEYRKETVKNCFEGIFVREFLLFYGDELECYLEEENGDGSQKTDVRVLSADSQVTDGTTQYELLNRISKEQAEGNAEQVEKELDNFLLLRYLAKELFPLV